MSPIRVLGSVLSLLTGLWALYVYFAVHAGGGGSLFSLLAAVGGLLIVDSLISLAGLRVSYLVGSALSVVLLLVVALQWGDFGSADAVVGVVLSICAAATDVVASRPAKGLAEKDSPLNLPVFG